jgi:hypothetical protein
MGSGATGGKPLIILPGGGDTLAVPDHTPENSAVEDEQIRGHRRVLDPPEVASAEPGGVTVRLAQWPSRTHGFRMVVTYWVDGIEIAEPLPVGFLGLDELGQELAMGDAGRRAYKRAMEIIKDTDG